MKTNNENKKAVIFARVSTEAQDYTEQVNRMTAVAMADGYSKSNLVVISNKEINVIFGEKHIVVTSAEFKFRSHQQLQKLFKSIYPTTMCFRRIKEPCKEITVNILFPRNTKYVKRTPPLVVTRQLLICSRIVKSNDFCPNIHHKLGLHVHS